MRLARATAIAIVTSVVALAPARAEDAARPLEFVAPRRLATVVGPSVAQLAVHPPAGATVVSVAFFVDGTASGVKSAPPFTFPWNGGDGTAGHRLAAVATFSDGTEARAESQTSRLTVNETEEVALVNVYAIARDPKGNYVADQIGRASCRERVSDTV